jgi:hypothetical protein
MTGNEEVQPAASGGTQPTPSAEGTGDKKSGRKAGRNAAVAVGVAALLIVVGAAAEPYAPGATEVKIDKNKGNGSMLNASDLQDLAFTVTGGKMKDLTVKLDGKAIDGTADGKSMVFKPTGLSEGKHTLSASSPGRLPGRKASDSLAFEVDTTPPKITIDDPGQAASLRSALKVTGKAEGAKAFTLGGEDIKLADDGTWSKEFAHAPAGIEAVATDEAGNVTKETVNVAVKHPGMRAAHMTALAWAYKPLHDPVVQMIKDGKIDTIQLDIKDEDGMVGYDSAVQLAKDSGATVKAPYVLADAVKEIHDLGARITGRIVAFRDPKLAKYAIKTGKMDMVIQDTSGNAYNAGTYGAASFTNFANDAVRNYNIDLGVEAAKAGFDDIMFDYIRRPEAHPTLSNQHFPGIGDTSPEQSIADFLGAAQPKIREAGAFVGAAVFGISSFTPVSVAQNIPMMAKHLDFISPMVYPSHWGKGEFSVANPNSSPYDIVNRSLKDFNRQVLGTNAQIIPWLQDFSLGVRYGEAEVRKQIQAAKDDGINSWLLWNATAKYTPSALDKKDKSSDLPGELVYSIGKPGTMSEGTKDAAAAKAYIDQYYKDKAAKENGTYVAPAATAPTNGTTQAGSTSGSTPAPTASPAATAASTEATATPAATP